MNSQPSPDEESAPGSRPRWPRYSLSTLLGLVTAAAVYMFAVPGGFQLLAITASWLLVAALLLGPLLAVQWLLFLLLRKSGLLPPRRR